MGEKDATDPISLFYCYEQEDKKLRDRMEKHLKALRRLDFIEDWSDLNVRAGSERNLTIEKHLRTADIILLLVSPSFIASDYCYNVLMKLALERYDAGEAFVVLILLRPAHWKDDKNLSRLMRLPSSDKPVTDWARSEAAFEDIVEGFHGILKKAWLKKGDAHYKAKRYELALNAFDKAVLQDPHFSPAHSRRGCVLYDLGYYQDAITSFKSAINCDPMDVNAHYFLGTLFYDRMDYERAHSCLTKAIQLDDLLTSAHIYMGLTLVELKKVEEAIKVYDNYLERHPRNALIIHYRTDLLNQLASRDFQNRMQGFGNQFEQKQLNAVSRSFSHQPSGIPDTLEEAQLLPSMHAFLGVIASLGDFQVSVSAFVGEYDEFLNKRHITLNTVVSEINGIKNDEIRSLLLSFLQSEMQYSTLRREFIGDMRGYLQGIDDMRIRDIRKRAIQEIYNFIDQWNTTLAKIASEELKAKRQQSQYLLNAIRRADSENIFQTNMEEDRS